ncbi:MAG TPA: cyclopropane-fatty-acyl-phospholipid synthase family protein [Xanthobacteraceae bacterium]|nr:cyclopropane-fatty-acyl-phospholipid synthase family protein [Xanthobacteraceae bacterium]
MKWSARWSKARQGRRLASLKQLLAQAHERLALGFGFVLWDGSTVPPVLSPNSLAVVIADEGVIGAVLRRPNLDTLANLWVTARIELRGGSVLDFLARRPRVSARWMLSVLDRRLVLAVAMQFLSVPRGGPWPLEHVRGDRVRADGSAAANKDNVHYHYDLSNAFYALFLDPEMIYTCAYFKGWNNDLATAQRDKLDMICRKLRLREGESLLDVGCGWGGLLCHAAQHYGVRAHGVTLAEEQYAFAKAKIARLRLEDRVTLELADYAAVRGRFDKIASIGMFEQVGIRNHPTYFQSIYRLLKPGGLYLHHAIARPNNAAFHRRPPGYAAIVRYIFPGGEVDHLGMSIANLERNGFEVHDVEAWREHYARTTRLWHDRLMAQRPAAEREVGPARTRLWLAYLAACAIFFENNEVGIFQTLASKRAKGASPLPPTRADLYPQS